MSFVKITEQPSSYRHIEKMGTAAILYSINKEDESISANVKKAIPEIEKLVLVIADKMLSGGRLFYLGAGTSGRLAIVDASECPPTFGVPHGLVIALIAGGERAIKNAVEFAEDNANQGWIDLQKHFVSEKDVVIGLSASGSTPYVLGALEMCRSNGIFTGSIVCNPGSPIANASDCALEVITGPEFITGSTRMKAGTAQKMVLNMISTAVMVLLGRVEDNSMVHMHLSNEKLVDRGVKMVMKQLNLDYSAAKKLLLQKGSVKKSLEI